MKCELCLGTYFMLTFPMSSSETWIIFLQQNRERTITSVVSFL
jgi:hypothetical protein